MANWIRQQVAIVAPSCWPTLSGSRLNLGLLSIHKHTRSIASSGLVLLLGMLAAGSDCNAQPKPQARPANAKESTSCIAPNGVVSGVLTVKHQTRPDGTTVAGYVLQLPAKRCVVAQNDASPRIDGNDGDGKIQTIHLGPSDYAPQEKLKSLVGKKIFVQLHGLSGSTDPDRLGEAVGTEPGILKYLDTPAGTLVEGNWAKQDGKHVCAMPPNSFESIFDECAVITLDGKPLMADPHIWIQAAYPNEARPRLVIVGTHIGGNGSPSRYHIIDVSKSRPSIMVGKEGEPQRFVAIDGGVQFERLAGEDHLGDTYSTRYRYLFGSGKVTRLGSNPKYYSIDPEKNPHPRQALSDKELRKPLLGLVGAKGFKAFRRNLDVGGGVYWIDKRFVVGEGCRPHDCSGNELIFVIDTIGKRAWALAFDGNKGVLWGSLQDEDVKPRNILEDWLKSWNKSWDMVERSPAQTGG